MESWRILIAVFIILVMVGICYFVSGISIFEGTIFERKTSVRKK